MNYLIVLFTFLICLNAQADSPLTSTQFHVAYKNETIVNEAVQGQLSQKSLDFLGKENNDASVKIALINKIGWGNFQLSIDFENYLLANRKGLEPKTFEYLRTVSEKKIKENKYTALLSDQDLMCWAYLNALGNYFSPGFSYSAALLAMNRKPNSMAHATVFALISCQKSMEASWCDVYKTAQKYFVTKTYTENMVRPEAIKIILDYLNIYKDDCK